MGKLAKNLKPGDRLGIFEGSDADSNLVVSGTKIRKVGTNDDGSSRFEVVVWCKGLHHPMFFDLDDEVL
jgi:hypothetical protein